MSTRENIRLIAGTPLTSLSELGLWESTLFLSLIVYNSIMPFFTVLPIWC